MQVIPRYADGALNGNTCRAAFDAQEARGDKILALIRLTLREHNENIGSFRQGGEPMPEVTYYVALPLIASDNGIAAGEPVECLGPDVAIRRAEALSRRAGHVGALAFSRSGNPSTGNFRDATIIRTFGNVPKDLSDL